MPRKNCRHFQLPAVDETPVSNRLLLSGVIPMNNQHIISRGIGTGHYLRFRKLSRWLSLESFPPHGIVDKRGAYLYNDKHTRIGVTALDVPPGKDYDHYEIEIMTANRRLAKYIIKMLDLSETPTALNSRFMNFKNFIRGLIY